LLTIRGHASHNHKGGTVAFGPDGYLYLGLGDGGTPAESQNPFSLFGSLIRIDVDHGAPYAIPPDNPFADGLEGAPEVYAYGFRNPWRWSFDPDGFIWLTDVGLSSWEEINIVQPGANYGWPILEGPDCRLEVNCNTEGLTPPLYAYPHDATGGYVVVSLLAALYTRAKISPNCRANLSMRTVLTGSGRCYLTPKASQNPSC
jgi:glucose/arabinose dehydrogenase